MNLPVDEESGISTAATHLTSELSDTLNLLVSTSKDQLHGSPAASSPSCYSRFKGVVLQHNGHWGAQIYSDHRRLWLGTFKSEESAAAAYDRAAITFRPDDPYRNLDNNFRRHHLQRLFHHHHPADAILGMIRDGSYDAKFSDYLISGCGESSSPTRAFLGGGFHLHQLFQKELTPSDVGKLNRLVIPKKYAVQYLPPVTTINTPTEAKGDGSGSGGVGGGGEVKGTMVEFRDREGKRWEFRYCYWSSSQSFVFTKGWNKFVKMKGLRARDTVVFYRCEERGTAACGGGKPFEVIDVIEYTGGGDNNGSATDMVTSAGLPGDKEEEEGEVVMRDPDDKDGDDDEDNNNGSVVDKRDGVWLFGVQIAD